MDFATNLKQICDMKNTTPTRVCKELGLSTNKVSLWNKGGVPKGDVLLKIANHLGCTVMDLLVDGNITLHNDLVLDDDEKDVIRVFRMLSRQQKHEFMSKAYSFEQQLIGKGGNEIV